MSQAEWRAGWVWSLAHAKGWKVIATVPVGRAAKSDPAASVVFQGQHSVTAASAFLELSGLLVFFILLFDNTRLLMKLVVFAGKNMSVTYLFFFPLLG